jgi:hypothetical protein
MSILAIRAPAAHASAGATDTTADTTAGDAVRDITTGGRSAAGTAPGTGVGYAAGADATAAGAAADGAVVSVLSYNVIGLARPFAGENPAARSAAIGWLAHTYDVVLLQEDFEHQRRIARQLSGYTVMRGNGMGWDPRRVAMKTLLFPVRLMVPHFSPPYGAGLTTFVERKRLTTSAVRRRRYHRCSGWVGSNLDCWAAKGFLRVRVGLDGGAAVDVYNTHLDAGSDKRSQAARRTQLAELAADIETHSRDRAVIVAGDLNCAYGRAGDWDLLMDFRARVGLADSGAGPVLPRWRERDHILYRSGRTAALAVTSAGEAVEFVNGDRALSDHPAVFARFRAVAPKPEAITR